MLVLLFAAYLHALMNEIPLQPLFYQRHDL